MGCDDERSDARRRKPRGRTGPTTAAGRSRSALNAFKHGMAARLIIAPDENQEAHERHFKSVVASLAPANEAEAAESVLIADDLAKLKRLERVEQSLLISRTEEAVASSDAGRRAATFAQALSALGGAMREWDGLDKTRDVEGPPHRVFVAIVSATEMVALLCVPRLRALLEECSDRFLPMRHKQAWAEEDVQAVTALLARLMGVLLDEADGALVAEDQVRQAVRMVALLHQRDLSLLSRYRRMLEDSLARRLGILEQLRKLSRRRRAPVAGALSEHHVKLRIVSART